MWMITDTYMVIFDHKTDTAFLKPYRPNKNSNTLVITLSKFFADKMDISSNTSMMMTLEKDGKTLTLQKVDL